MNDDYLAGFYDARGNVYRWTRAGNTACQVIFSHDDEALLETIARYLGYGRIKRNGTTFQLYTGKRGDLKNLRARIGHKLLSGEKRERLAEYLR